MNKTLMVSMMFGILILALQKTCHILKSKRFVKKEYALASFGGFRGGYRLKIQKHWPAAHERKKVLNKFEECCDEAERFIKGRFLYFIFPRHFHRLWNIGW